MPATQVEIGRHHGKTLRGSAGPEPGTPDDGNFLIRET